jgi:hypothetical protein
LMVIVPNFRAEKTDDNSIVELKNRVAQLEAPLSGKSEVESRRERNQARARERVAVDVSRLRSEAVHEAEVIYQSAKKQAKAEDIAGAMQPLLDKFPNSNRAGCGALFMARLLPADQKKALLLRCVDEWSDCYFLDGTSVGGMARLYLSESTNSERFLSELKSDFADAIDFSGESLVEMVFK